MITHQHAKRKKQGWEEIVMAHLRSGRCFSIKIILRKNTKDDSNQSKGRLFLQIIQAGGITSTIKTLGNGLLSTNELQTVVESYLLGGFILHLLGSSKYVGGAQYVCKSCKKLHMQVQQRDEQIMDHLLRLVRMLCARDHYPLFFSISGVRTFKYMR